MSAIQSIRLNIFAPPLTECKDTITSIWNSIRFASSSPANFEKSVARVWHVVKEAAKAFPIITFVFFRTLQILVPLLGLGIEVVSLYLKTTFTNFQHVKSLQTQHDLSLEVESLKDELSTLKESLADITTTRNNLENENLLLNSGYKALETAFSQNLAKRIEAEEQNKTLEKTFRVKR